MAANPELLDPRTISDYYSVARLALPRARAEFVLPDLKPLPKLRSACPRGGSPTARKEVVR